MTQTFTTVVQCTQPNSVGTTDSGTIEAWVLWMHCQSDALSIRTHSTTTMQSINQRSCLLLILHTLCPSERVTLTEQNRHLVVERFFFLKYNAFIANASSSWKTLTSTHVYIYFGRDEGEIILSTLSRWPYPDEYKGDMNLPEQNIYAVTNQARIFLGRLKIFDG